MSDHAFDVWWEREGFKLAEGSPEPVRNLFGIAWSNGAFAATTEARSIIERLVQLVNKRGEYDEDSCPNGPPACAACRLVTEAKAFLNR